MDKKTATLTLTGKLHNDTQIVANQLYQKSLIEKSLAHYQIGDMVKMSSDFLYDIVKKGMDARANYFFIENIDWGEYASGASFAIIGEEEVRTLRGRFYKDVPCDVASAMAALGIKGYAQLYEMYSNGSIEGLLRKYELYSKFRECFSDLFRSYDQLFHDDKCLEGVFEGYMGMTLGDLNQGLKKEGIPASVENHHSYVYKNHVSSVMLAFEQATILGQFKDLLEGFIDFVFKIPDEDQNVGINKLILGMENASLDYTRILIEEYNQDRNFQEYFSVLDEERQEKVVKRIKNLSKQNMSLNSWLFSKGFALELDYIRLYKEDTEEFIRYFRKSSLEIQELIVSDLLNCDFINPEAISFLEEEYSDLLRDTAFKGIHPPDLKIKLENLT